MLRTVQTFSFVVLVAALTASSAMAQNGTLVGAQVGYDADVEELFFGANAVFDLPLQIGDVTLRGNPEFDYFLIGDNGGVSTSLWTVTLNALYPLTLEFADTYAGAGLAISRWSVSYDFNDLNDLFSKGSGIIVEDYSDTDIGLNIKIGANFGRESNIKPFAEAGLILGDGTRLYAQGGARIGI